MNFPAKPLFLSIIFSWGLAGSMNDKKEKASNDLVKKNSMILSDHLQKNPPDTFIASLLAKYPQYFDDIVKKREDLKVQIIYTSIDRKKKNKIKFTDHFYHADSTDYFYPASTVKLPIAILALQRLNELKIPGLDKYSVMITGAEGEKQTPVLNDSSSANGTASIAHYIKKILLVSDNDAFNRLYEFLGQEYINNTLHKMGYSSAQIIHRLNIFLSEQENRYTNPVSFYDAEGKLLYAKPAEKSQFVYTSRNTKMGKGFYRGDELVNEPFDFSKKNRLSLQDLHSIVRAVMFPESIAAAERFNLTKDDYDFLRKYMSMMPTESVHPSYPAPGYWDTYVKFIFYGAEKNAAEPHIRIFNKPGDAYGFMIDAVYFADHKNNIEFCLSAVIYCNSDGILNDDKYDYKTVGLPFMKNLGRVIYEYELKRQRKKTPDLGLFRFSYKD